MAAKRHWMVTAGLISGFAIIAFIAVSAVLLTVTRGFRWRYLTGVAGALLVVGLILRELLRPDEELTDHSPR